MRPSIVAALALLLGCPLYFSLFGLAFTRSVKEFNLDSIVPLLLAFAVALILTLVQPRAAIGVVVGMSMPSVLFGALLFCAVLAEGKGTAWGHPLTALTVIGVTTCGVVAGRYIGHESGDPTK